MLCGILTQTREELLNGIKEITTLQKRYDVFSVIYGLFSLGKHETFYEEMEKFGIEVTGRKHAFSTSTSKKVFVDDWLKFKYKDRGCL